MSVKERRPMIPLAEPPPKAAAGREIHLYYPDEGFGSMYRRVLVNDLFTDLMRRTRIRTVAEVPLDSYELVGAGSLIFAHLGADLTLISDDEQVLARGQALMRFNSVSQVRYLHSSLHSIPVADDAFDLTWSFDALLPVPNKEAFLRELCRISKATFLIVPYAYSYGQLLHHLYHVFTKTTCVHAGPRGWMRSRPIREALRRGGMEIAAEGIIDVPWWPSFPELPNMVRRMLGRPPVKLDSSGVPEASPRVVRTEEVPALRRRVTRNAFVERSRILPRPLKLLFAHNLYVLGCKPQHRLTLGL